MGLFLVICASPHHPEVTQLTPSTPVDKATEHNGGGICNFPKTTKINIFSQRTYRIVCLRSQKMWTSHKELGARSPWNIAECMIRRAALLLDHLVPLAVVEGVPLEELVAVETPHQGVRVHALCTTRRHARRCF